MHSLVQPRVRRKSWQMYGLEKTNITDVVKPHHIYQRMIVSKDKTKVKAGAGESLLQWLVWL